MVFRFLSRGAVKSGVWLVRKWGLFVQLLIACLMQTNIACDSEKEKSF